MKTYLFAAVPIFFLVGCGKDRPPQKDFFEAKADMVYCVENAIDTKTGKCKGKTDFATEVSLRLFYDGRAGTWFVSKPSADTIARFTKLENCIVWDRSNWECETTHDSGAISSLTALDGRLVSYFKAGPNVTPLYYSGALK